MMRHTNRVLEVLTIVFCALLTSAVAPAHADVSGDMARKIVTNYGAGAVTLQIVLKSSSGDGGDQAEREIDGVVLDSSGLIVTANTNVDPGSAYAAMTGEDSAYSTKVVNVKILAAGGQEIPARVVLRDKDRNLAFVRPLQKPKKPLTPISFAKKSGARIGDAIYILSRLGKTGGRQASVTSERIVSVIQKPRLMYVIMPNMYSAMGNVVFNEQGQALGLLTMRIGLKTGDSALPVVVPTQDIMEIARQAPPANKAKN